MNESNHLDDEPRDLDLSSLTFDEFAAFFFAGEVVPDDEQYGYFLTDVHGETYFESVPSSPEVLVNHLTKLFTQFGQIASKYTLAQVDQGIWGMWGVNLRLYELLFDPPVPLMTRLYCIRSMYHVFSSYVSKLERDARLRDRERILHVVGLNSARLLEFVSTCNRWHMAGRCVQTGRRITRRARCAI
jgi:hypothetical protein